MRKTILYFLVFLLIISVSLAADDDIFYRDNLDIDLDISSEINISYTGSGHVVNYIEASLSFYPKDTFRQDILSMDIYPIVEPSDNIIKFRWTNPSEKTLIYKVDSKLKTYNKFKKVKTKVNFPIKKLDTEYLEYTEAGELIDINDDIITLASSLAEGEDDLYVVVNNIASWVNKNVDYSLSTFTKDASRRSSWVLENKKGVCDELTNLFISMCRSLGIPGRFVSGYAYTNSPLFAEEWGAHGWAEIYFPNYGWVPFDVTYGQMGYIDAGHIKFKDTVDSDKSSVEYQWQGRNINIKTESLSVETEITKKGDFLNPLLGIEAKPLSKEIDFGSYNLIEATLTNNQGFYIIADVSLFKPEGIDIIGDYKQFILIKPKSSEKVYWIIKIPDDLQRRSIYTFPLVISTLRNQTYELEFKSSYGEVSYDRKEIQDILKGKQEESAKTYSKNLELSCSSDDEVPLNKEFTVSCNLKNFGNTNLENIKLCLEKDCKTLDLTIMQEKTAEFEKLFSEEGEKSILVTAKNDEVAKSSTIRVLVVDKPLVDIKDVKSPENVNYKDDFFVSFVIEKASLATPKELEINFYLNNMLEKWTLDELIGEKAYQLNMKGSNLKLNENNIEILIKYKDDYNNKYSVEETFAIILNNPGFGQKITIFVKQILYKITSLFS